MSAPIYDTLRAERGHVGRHRPRGEAAMRSWIDNVEREIQGDGYTGRHRNDETRSGQ